VGDPTINTGEVCPKTLLSWTVILKGDGERGYTPLSTFHGFRYVELTRSYLEAGFDHAGGLAAYFDLGTGRPHFPFPRHVHRIHDW